MQKEAKVTGKVICTIKGSIDSITYFYEGKTVRDILFNWPFFPPTHEIYLTGRVFTLDGADLPLDHILQLDQTYIFPLETVLVSRDLISVSMTLVEIEI